MEARCFKSDGTVRHEVRGVDRDFLVVVGAEGLDAAHVEVFRRLAEQSLQPAAVCQVVVVRQRSVRHAVNSEEFRRDALPQPAGVLGIDKKVALGVGMRVDETRRDRESTRVDYSPRNCLRQVADALDTVPSNANIRSVGRRARPVYDIASADNYIEHDSLLCWTATSVPPNLLDAGNSKCRKMKVTCPSVNSGGNG